MTEVVFSFSLPSTGERWHWPVDGEDSIDAFAQILDRANIGWSSRTRNHHESTPESNGGDRQTLDSHAPVAAEGGQFR